AQAGSVALEPVVKRRAAKRTAGAILFARPGHRVVLGIGLERPRTHPARIEVVLAETANVDRPEIEGRLAFGDPLGKRHASAPAGRNAEGVKASADKDAAHLRSLAQDDIAIR